MSCWWFCRRERKKNLRVGIRTDKEGKNEKQKALDTFYIWNGEGKREREKWEFIQDTRATRKGNNTHALTHPRCPHFDVLIQWTTEEQMGRAGGSETQATDGLDKRGPLEQETRRETAVGSGTAGGDNIGWRKGDSCSGNNNSKLSRTGRGRCIHMLSFCLNYRAL